MLSTAGIDASMKSFVSYCNGLGGINGRKLELKTYDAKLVNVLAAINQACDDKLFALVGDGVVQDAPMAQPMIDCGLVGLGLHGHVLDEPQSQQHLARPQPGRHVRHR